ncbi:sulfotransferase domain-containing protein [Erythrobacter sp. MTPC3]|uniref:sulfotransferase domain-containing protein n=1 Tax=Erythrobacter sp. MTPC3 TaxID=3056564 RepID=UPI0036F21E10
MLIRKPEKTIRTWHTDSRIWDGFELRAGDIIVCTPPKTGTTWTQRIVGMLLAQSTEPRHIMDEQPWLDARFIPQGEVAAALTAQPGRRGLKTHSPLTALPLHDDVLYINVARDPRDAVMSFHNHSNSFTEDFLAGRDADGLADPEIAAPFPRAPEDQRAFFRRWLRDPEHAPFDDFTIDEFCEIETSFWEARDRPNVMQVHYNDLKADRAGEMRRIAQFCGIETPEPLFREMVEAAGFASMKRSGSQLLGLAEVAFKGGADSFLHKGTNDRWRGVLNEEDLADYRAAMKARVSDDLARWLEFGRLAALDASEPAGAAR